MIDLDELNFIIEDSIIGNGLVDIKYDSGGDAFLCIDPDIAKHLITDLQESGYEISKLAVKEKEDD